MCNYNFVDGPLYARIISCIKVNLIMGAFCNFAITDAVDVTALGSMYNMD